MIRNGPDRHTTWQPNCHRIIVVWRVLILAAAVPLGALAAAAPAPDRVERIVAESVQNTNADWSAAPRYDFTERDVITKGGKHVVRTYEVIMVDGSPYQKAIATGGRPLSAVQRATEDRKLNQEIARRRAETAAQRQKRVAEYDRERRQDHLLMQEMVRAFDFKLAGEETVNGRRCYVLNATPRPDYQPTSRETKVLKGMRGKMWIDEQQKQWVKVHAEVFRPVAFGLFFAHVQPGTEFELEQKPVEGNLWLPSHFMVHVKAQVLLWSRRSADDETYTNYHHSAALSARVAHRGR